MRIVKPTLSKSSLGPSFADRAVLTPIEPSLQGIPTIATESAPGVSVSRSGDGEHRRGHRRAPDAA